MAACRSFLTFGKVNGEVSVTAGERMFPCSLQMQFWVKEGVKPAVNLSKQEEKIDKKYG